jgi:hypothetical protein
MWRWLTWTAMAGLALGLGWGQLPDAPPTTFGVTVVDPFGMRGDIYLLKPGTPELPKFEKMEPIGSIYASALNIVPRNFLEGFPGITNRYEWFAIDYKGFFYVDPPGKYNFGLASDDGSKLYIDGKQVIDNDGVHPTQAQYNQIALKGGIHRIRVSYFQGPGAQLALILGVKRPGEEWRIFSTNDFRPPRNPADWKYGDPNDIPKDPAEGRRKPVVKK